MDSTAIQDYRKPERMARVAMPSDVFTLICVETARISDGLLALTRVLCSIAEGAQETSLLNKTEPFLMGINLRIDSLQGLLRICMEESAPPSEAYHG